MEYNCIKHKIYCIDDAIECPICRNEVFLSEENCHSWELSVKTKIQLHLQQQNQYYISITNFIKQYEKEKNELQHDIDRLKNSNNHLEKSLTGYNDQKLRILEGVGTQIRDITENKINLYLSNIAPYSDRFIEEFEKKLKISFKKSRLSHKVVALLILPVVKQNLKSSLSEAFTEISDRERLKSHRNKYSKKIEAETKKLLDDAIKSIVNESIKLYEKKIDLLDKDKKRHYNATRFAAFILFGIATLALVGNIFQLSNYTRLHDIRSGWQIIPYGGLLFFALILTFLGVKLLRLNVTDHSMNNKEPEISVDELFTQFLTGTQITTEVTQKLLKLKTSVKALIEKNK